MLFNELCIQYLSGTLKSARTLSGESWESFAFSSIGQVIRECVEVVTNSLFSYVERLFLGRRRFFFAKKVILI